MLNLRNVADEIRLVTAEVVAAIMVCAVPLMVMAIIDQCFGTTSIKQLLPFLHPHLLDFIIAAVLAPVLFVVNIAISSFIHVTWPPQVVMHDVDDAAQTTAGNLIESGCAGFSEEFLFRGIIQSFAGIWLASMAFGLVHYRKREYWGDVARTALFGFQLGLLFMLSGSLIACMIIHAANNFFSVRAFPDRLDAWFARRFAHWLA